MLHPFKKNPITLPFNKTFVQGKISRAWKKKTQPNVKNESKKQTLDYRLLSVTSIVYKLR